MRQFSKTLFLILAFGALNALAQKNVIVNDKDIIIELKIKDLCAGNCKGTFGGGADFALKLGAFKTTNSFGHHVSNKENFKLIEEVVAKKNKTYKISLSKLKSTLGQIQKPKKVSKYGKAYAQGLAVIFEHEGLVRDLQMSSGSLIVGDSHGVGYEHNGSIVKLNHKWQQLYIKGLDNSDITIEARIVGGEKNLNHDDKKSIDILRDISKGQKPGVQLKKVSTQKRDINQKNVNPIEKNNSKSDSNKR